MKTFRDQRLEAVRLQVQNNCDISDALYSGGFSLCTFLLLIRNYYKWFHDLQPWEEGESEDTLQWIERREQTWEDIEHEDMTPIDCGGVSCDPFEKEEINRFLNDDRLLYGAGYAYGMKPTFFLGEVRERHRIDDMEISILGMESARDMPALPALRQGDMIYIRGESARYYLYDRISERFMTGKKSIRWAMNKWDVHALGGLPEKLDTIVEQELMTMVHHEIGEASENVFGEDWAEILRRFAATSVERFARSVRDVLADTNEKGLLHHLIEEKKAASLGLYVSFLDGFPKLMFPAMKEAFERFIKSEDWKIIEDARREGYRNATQMAQQLLLIFRQTLDKSEESARKDIESSLINPLYCGKGE